MMHRSKLAAGIVAAALFLACSDDPSGPGGTVVVPESDLTFVAFAGGVLPGPVDTTFWAVKGQETDIRLRPLTGTVDEAYFEFELGEESLLRRPDGSLFQDGDSIQISISMPNDSQFVFIMEPSGLVFDPDEPAELKLDWSYADDDLNRDGSIDPDDDDFETEMAIWKQETPGGPWERLGTLKLEDLEEAEADITSFTGFALAGN